ncbi:MULTISPECIES: sensor histidine kinase [unclassified Streptomyces]|uniref:sensor histidine kinase n=1 Tax=unclassified Streptomyces TaxID=2593676 RepID=UPI0016567813|nr:histidine kinase [Streptomyces sp. CB02980]MCB8901871.1 histidine kinase [Streptomyces sp. CB02980]
MRRLPSTLHDALRQGRTYARGLHLLLGGAVGPVCVLVWPGITDNLGRTLAACALVPVVPLLLLGLVPGTRRAEGIQARLLLVPDDENDIGRAPARSLSDRRRTSVWLVLRCWWGLLVATVVAQLLSVTGTLASAPAVEGARTILGVTIPGGHRHIWYLGLVPPLLLAAFVLVVWAGHVQLALARRLLGPSTAERLAEAERLADELLARNRLAGELHDSIGHALTVTVLQASAARELIDTDRDFAIRALTAIEDTGRRAMDDLERTLGYLKEDETAARTVRPTLADVGQLLEASRAAGVTVRSRTVAEVDAVPGVVSREAYRILQEALTNAMKHAPGSPVDVDLDVTGEQVRLTVANALVEEAPRAPGTGKGLRSLRERAALLGGRATAGAASGRWTVSARLPLRLGS